MLLHGTVPDRKNVGDLLHIPVGRAIRLVWGFQPGTVRNCPNQNWLELQLLFSAESRD